MFLPARDYTGDGKADVAVPVPGDYDGDGKFDAAVFRPSAAAWFLDRSTAGVQIVPFGLASDQPVPNAYVR